MIAAYN